MSNRPRAHAVRSTLQHGIASAFALTCACARAAAASPGPVEPSFAGGLAQTLLGLAIVLALIWGAAWVMRRLNVGTSPSGSAIRVLATQALGQRERVVLLEVADQWLLVGVAAGQVSALATLPKGKLPERTPAPSPFASLLTRAQKRDEPQEPHL